MDYKTPAALENAIKDAARHSAIDTDRAITLFWWDRFLSRIFSPDNPEFVLKGGLSMLARMGGRYTRDIDLAAGDDDIDTATRRLIELASLELHDFFHFTSPIAFFAVEHAESLVRRLVDPLLGDDALPGRWNPERLDWETRVASDHNMKV